MDRLREANPCKNSSSSATASTAWLKNANLKPETKYCVYRRQQSGASHIWHIHGEADKPNTITLGHEQYSGYLQKMRDYIMDGYNKNNPNGCLFIKGKEDFDTTGQVYSWLDLFLRDELHILGFGFDYTEIDLWWMLIYKARLQKARQYTVGKTYYHFIYNKTIRDEEKARMALLRSMGVIVKEKDANGNYTKAYDEIIDTL